MKRCRMNQYVAAVVVALGAGAAQADEILVPDHEPTIQRAIDVAQDGDEIVLADGTFSGPGNKNLQFVAGRALTVRSGSGNRGACLVDCGSQGRFATLTNQAGAVVFQSLTVINGNAGGANGGAVLVVAGGCASFLDCAFQDCVAFKGGAIHVEAGGDATIDGCLFAYNFAVNGGGGVDAEGGRISRSIFLENVTGFGGGGARLRSDFEEISDSLFQGNLNTGFGGGGGLNLVSGAQTLVRNVAFIGNRSYFGAGAEITGSPPPAPTFVNCLFARNEAGPPKADGDLPSGGGVDSQLGTSSFVNCTFTRNTSGGYGGAVCAYDDAHVTLVGCVLWDNDAPDGPEIRVSYPGSFYEGGTVTVSSSDVAGGEAGVSIGALGTLEWGAGNIDCDPLFFDPENDDYRLSTGSCVIDAGDGKALPPGVTTDIDGRPRLIDGDGNATTAIDMGAHEFQTCPIDVDQDGMVGFGDLLRVLSAWGPYAPCPPAIPEDVDHDCQVGFSDLLAVLSAWGPCS